MVLLLPQLDGVELLLPAIHAMPTPARFLPLNISGMLSLVQLHL
jgi:hypothetical protein